MDDRDVAQHWDDNAPEWVRAVREGWDTCRLFINNPAFFEQVHQTASSGEANPELSLQHRSRTKLRSDDELHRLHHQIVVGVVAA